MRKVSIKRKTQLDEYKKIRLEFLQENSYCQICGDIATDIHHKNKRNGPRLNNVSNFCALCNHCHINVVHANPEWSYVNGYMKRVNNK